VSAAHVYIHVPFCARRCIYCDFSIAVRARVPVDDYLDALGAEWRLRHPHATGHLETLYLGGGTPSKLGGEGVTRLLDLARRHCDFDSRTEVTLEANPEDVTTESARAWREAGVTRISLGVQSFNDAILQWMHRTHDAAKARRAVHVLREVGLPNVSIDLIFATPPHLAREWAAELDSALELAVPHISVYGLTVEAHTPLGRQVARRDAAEAPEESFEREFIRAHVVLTASGYEHYEVSNYGWPGAHSRHNWAYWRRSPYIGLGPSAHEFLGGSRRWNKEAYAHWTETLARGEDPVAGAEVLEPEQVVAEEVYLGLRTSAGLSVSQAEHQRTARWIAAGWAELIAADRLRLTAAGWLRLDAIASDLTAFRSRC
jgi:oxygen-independent coproporphyrinogen III oxidase